MRELINRREVNQIALRFYMQYFQMRGQNLVDSFRDLCRKLHLKAESQEIDRIIEAFSARYFECNPSSVFGTAGVVHTVTAAMLMLNTDLHIADLSKHMSRSDFVRNSMRAVQESMPNNGTDSTPDLVRDDSTSTDHDSLNTTAGSIKDRRPRDAPPTNRSASAPVTSQSYNTHLSRNPESSGTSSSFAYSKAWEQEAETALKVSQSRTLMADRTGHLCQRESRSDTVADKQPLHPAVAESETPVCHVYV
jgi:PH/SEC7 domain-containing protein